jgi:lambda family phage portal protein
MALRDRISGMFGQQRAAVAPTAEVPASFAVAAAPAEARAADVVSTPIVVDGARSASMQSTFVLPGFKSAGASSHPAPVAAVRLYKAAESTRLTTGLPSVSMSPDQISLRTLRTLRARSRFEIANNDIARRAMSLYDTGVIGQGINLHGQIVDDNGKPDEEANKAIEQGWRDWCKPGNCEITGMSFWDVTRLYELATIGDGEVLVRLHQGPEFGPWGFQVELIDPELLEIEDNRTFANGNYVRLGIEYDTMRRPVAYWITQPDPHQGLLSYGYTGRRSGLRVPAAGMLHRFIREKIGETRGTPRLANCLLRLAHLEGAEDAALVALRIGASKIAWLKNDGTGARYVGEDQGIDSIGNIDSPAHRIVDADIGSMGELPPGWDIKSWDPQYPNNEYAPFQKRLLQNLGSGMDLPYFELGNDLEGVNYSSAKIGQMSEHDTFQKHQRYVIDGLCWPLFNIWLESALLTGRLRFPGRNAEVPWAKIDKFRNVRFQARTWEGADRHKEVMADVLAVESMQTTLTDVIRKRNGRDFLEVLKEREREIAAMKLAGIPQSPALNEQLLAMLANDDKSQGSGNEDRPQ